MPESVFRLRKDSRTCLDLASTALTDEARAVLEKLSAEYEDRAKSLETPRQRSVFIWPLD